MKRRKLRSLRKKKGKILISKKLKNTRKSIATLWKRSWVKKYKV